MSQCATEAEESEAAEAPFVELPERLYYGWVMLPLSMAALVASSPGQTFGVSIFNEPMRQSLDLSHGQLAAAYTLGTLFGAIPITFIGSLMDRHGLRRTMLGVLSVFSLACLLTSSVQNLAMLVVAFCFLRMLGPGALAFLSGNTLAFWFDRRLGAVEGLRQLGMAAAMALIPAINVALVAHFGWRGAYFVLGLVLWGVLFPLFALFYRNHPGEVGQELDGGRLAARKIEDRTPPVRWGLSLAETLRTGAFWIVTSGTVAFSLIHTAVFFCLVPILHDRGLTDLDAAATLMSFAVSLAVLQLVGGMAADRLPAPPLLFLGMCGLSAGVLLMFLAHTTLATQAAGVLLGASQGIFFGATQPLWPRYFGRQHLGKIRGVLMTANVALSSLGPLIAGLTRDLSGSFGPALIAFVVLPLPIAVLSLFVSPPAGERGALGAAAAARA